MEEDDYAEHSDREGDPKHAVALDRLRSLFDLSPKRVFYSRQLETMHEREIFHWITSRALNELAARREIQRISEPVAGQQHPVNFYASKKLRYVRREIARMRDLLTRIFDSDFTHAVGKQCELMFDAAFARFGFQIAAKDANSWAGATWTDTRHDLDRIVTLDGVAYGVEMKNTQTYIDRDELFTKLKLCQHLKLKPLFIMRYAPKTYVYEIDKRKGFGLLFEHQFYPWGHAALLEQVQTQLGLKVHCPRDVPQAHMERFLKWHIRKRPNR